MADQYVQVPPNSSGSKIDTSELTVGANTVERQRMVIADPTDATALADVKAASAAAVATDMALVVAISPNNTLPTNVTQIAGGTLSTATTGVQNHGIAYVGTGLVSTAATGVQKIGLSGHDGADVDAPVGSIGTNSVTVTHAPSTASGTALTTRTFNTQATAVNIKNAAGNIFGWALTTASAGFIQFFNTSATSTTGAGLIIPCTAGGTSNYIPGAYAIASFATGISINVATTVGGTTEVNTTGTVFYK